VLAEVLRAQSHVERGDRDQAKEDDPTRAATRGDPDRAGPSDPAAGMILVELAFAEAKSRLQDPPAEQPRIAGSR
jgi:hypothetical protein